jgi:hypothetical protein
LTARSIALATLLAAGCAGPPPDPPTAVIDASPEELCSGDGFATVIALSGARSSGRLSLVPAPPDPSAPLTFRWDLTGAEHHVVSGDLDARALEVVASGDRPLHVSLTVTSSEGGEATSLRTIGVNVPIPTPCDDGCPAGMECAPYLGGMACLPSGTCATDDDCPTCFVCDATRCVPRETP